MAIAVCLRLPDPPVLPQITIPQLGVLRAARQSLYDLPDASYFLMRMQEAAQLALAPFRRFVDLFETILAVQDCFYAVIDAVTQLSPQPIVDAIGSLVKAIARLTTYIPPLCYLPTLLDIARYVISIIDEIISLLVYLDGKVSGYAELASYAAEMEDTDLAQIVVCASREVTVLINNSMDLLQVISMLLRIILEPIVRFMPGSPLKDKLETVMHLPEQLADLSAALASGTTPVSAQLGDILELLGGIRNMAVEIYNVAAPLVGRPSDMLVIDLPTLENS